MTDETAPDPEPAPFATHEELESRWHRLTDAERSQADELLEDASEIIRNHVARYPETQDPAWRTTHRRGLQLVACQMVRTAMEQQVAGLPGAVTQASETAGPFTSSYSWASPDGYLRWNKGFLDTLGLSGQRLCAIDMATGRAVPS